MADKGPYVRKPEAVESFYVSEPLCFFDSRVRTLGSVFGGEASRTPRPTAEDMRIIQEAGTGWVCLLA
jgi:hypothetical protein